MYCGYIEKTEKSLTEEHLMNSGFLHLWRFLKRMIAEQFDSKTIEEVRIRVVWINPQGCPQKEYLRSDQC